MKRPSYGYRQALMLLEKGEGIRWNNYPASKATINGVTVHYNAWLKLHGLLEPVDKNSLNPRYRLKHVKG